MRFFRSPELAFWAVVVVLLGALLSFAMLRGERELGNAGSAVPVAAPAATSSEAGSHVRALLALMPSGIAAGTNPAGLRAYASAVTDEAKQGASIRRGEGAADTDAMLRGFERVTADAARLQSQAHAPVAATALRTQIGLDVSHLHLLVLGQPAPDLPDSGLDPYNTPQQLSPAAPAAPNRPAMPTLPKEK